MKVVIEKKISTRQLLDEDSELLCDYISCFEQNKPATCQYQYIFNCLKVYRDRLCLISMNVLSNADICDQTRDKKIRTVVYELPRDMPEICERALNRTSPKKIPTVAPKVSR